MEKRSERNLGSHKRFKDDQVLYGTRPVIEAILAGKEFERLYIQKNINNELNRELMDLLKENRIQYLRVPVEKLNSITRKNHQGVIAFISPISYASLDNIITMTFESGNSPFVLILDRITDVRNFGAICRTAEAAGVHAIVVPVRGSAQINSDAMKTSAGALNYIPVCRENNLLKTIDFLKQSGLFIVGCTEKAEMAIHNLDLNRPIGVILGSEENGILPEYLKNVDATGRFPIHGNVSSLNVSVAAGILIYEVLRQREL